MKHFFWIIIIYISLITLSCGTARRGETVAQPLQSLSVEAAQGEMVFMQYCNSCHPGGAAGLGPAINNKSLPGGMLKFQVRHGLGVMPAFKKEVISEEKLDHLVAYLKTIRKNKDRKENQAVAHN